MPEGAHRFELGSLSCTVLSDGYVSHPATWLFPNADARRLWQCLESRRLPLDRVLMPYTCLLVETGRHVVLVDTGGGAISPSSGAIVARLDMAGIRRSDVDTVVLTHAHPDHIGGAVDGRGFPVFPHARYVLAEAEWDFWTATRASLESLRVPDDVKELVAQTARRNLAALRLQIEPIACETEIVPGVRAIPAPGHTPGHLAILLSSGDCHLLNLGDAAVHPLHLQQPEWENGFDLSPVEALATRRALAERAVAERMHVMAFHFPFPSVGTVAPADTGWEWKPGW